MVKVRPPSSSPGFSLVEMLVVVAIIGVLAALAVMNLSRVSNNARDARDRRNAQSLASTTTAAQAAGVDFVDPAGDLDRTIENVVTGGYATIDYMRGTYFGVPHLGEDAREGAARFLMITPGRQLLYVEAAEP